MDDISQNVSTLPPNDGFTEDVDLSSDPARRKLSRPPTMDKQSRIIWPYVIGVGLFHLLIPLAFIPNFFSWWGVLWLPIGNYLFCSVGIGAGLHRLHTHRSYKCPLWFEHFLALLGWIPMIRPRLIWVSFFPCINSLILLPICTDLNFMRLSMDAKDIIIYSYNQKIHSYK